MQTIVINSQKGGSGKTSLCAHLSVEAERAGDGPVYLIDTDPQGTLSTWHETRTAEAPHRVDVNLSGLAPALSTLAQREAALCFIDTAPNRGEDNAELFRLADLVLVPVRPSPSDLWAVSATVATPPNAVAPAIGGTATGSGNGGGVPGLPLGTARIFGRGTPEGKPSDSCIQIYLVGANGSPDSRGSTVTSTPNGAQAYWAVWSARSFGLVRQASI